MASAKSGAAESQGGEMTQSSALGLSMVALGSAVPAGSVKARPGSAWRGEARPGEAWRSRHGTACFGWLRLGRFRYVTAGLAWKLSKPTE
jgi:hypothetical protein